MFLIFCKRSVLRGLRIGFVVKLPDIVSNGQCGANCWNGSERHACQVGQSLGHARHNPAVHRVVGLQSRVAKFFAISLRIELHLVSGFSRFTESIVRIKSKPVRNSLPNYRNCAKHPRAKCAHGAIKSVKKFCSQSRVLFQHLSSLSPIFGIFRIKVSGRLVSVVETLPFRPVYGRFDCGHVGRANQCVYRLLADDFYGNFFDVGIDFCVFFQCSDLAFEA